MRKHGPALIATALVGLAATYAPAADPTRNDSIGPILFCRQPAYQPLGDLLLVMEGHDRLPTPRSTTGRFRIDEAAAWSATPGGYGATAIGMKV
jgi:hypothetical protein